MFIEEHLVLKWLHIIAMTYWLGGEWGVFNSSRYIDKPDIPLAERLRHMETAYRIDILARTGIILLLPLGLHMGFNLGVQPLGGSWLVLNWVLAAAWLALCWGAFYYRGTDYGVQLTKMDEAVRYVVIPALLITGVWSLVADGPFTADWYSAKVTIYGLLLVIGLVLRYIMRDWVAAFRQLSAASGPMPEVEAKMHNALQTGRTLAYFYWFGIALVGFIGAVKPF